MELTKRTVDPKTSSKYKDPELDIDVWTLGLICEVKVDGRHVKIVLTFRFAAMPVRVADGG